jgi:large subunit ribosomal protein L9
MEVILTEDVPKLGEMGDVVSVAPGYGRNYLIPQGLALPASADKKAELDHKKQQIEVRKERERAAAKGVQSKLEGVRITIPKRVAEEDTLYGSVSAREIADVLAQEGFEVEHRFIEVGKGLDELGIYRVPVKLASGVFAHIIVWVVTV